MVCRAERRCQRYASGLDTQRRVAFKTSNRRKSVTMPKHLQTLFFAAVVTLAPAVAGAAEFYIGEPIEKDGMQIVPNYLVGIEMDHMAPGMEMGADSIHLEADVHATKGETHGFPEDAWIPYLTIRYTLTRQGDSFKKTGVLAPMTAGDGPHYANNVIMGAPGTYDLIYEILPPSSNNFIRHVDKATGVPPWGAPITAHWTFTYGPAPEAERKGRSTNVPSSPSCSAVRKVNDG
jgi:uncharacterized protein involved in high-affinity Fe2+ transport